MTRNRRRSTRRPMDQDTLACILGTGIMFAVVIGAIGGILVAHFNLI